MIKVSVLVSAYNAEKYIQESIESILNQTYRNIEILIVDDGSTDKTADILDKISDPRIIFKMQQNIGKSATLNKLIDVARGDFILIQDADDISSKDRIEKLLHIIENDDSIGLVMSGHSLIINNKIVAPLPRSRTKSECKKLILEFKLPAHDPTMMVRTDIAKSVCFDESLSLGEGLDFVLQVGEKHEIVALKDTLYNYRIYPESITKRSAHEKAAQILHVINKANARRGLPILELDEFFEVNKRWLRDRNNNLAGHFALSTYLSLESGRRLEALKTSFCSLKYSLHDRKFLIPLIYAISPLGFVRWGKTKFGTPTT